jgi:hypothetical protein
LERFSGQWFPVFSNGLSCLDGRDAVLTIGPNHSQISFGQEYGMELGEDADYLLACDAP